MTLRTMGASFAPVPGGNAIITDIIPVFTNYGVYSPGATRVAEVSTNPSLSAHWTVLGWSARLRVCTIKLLQSGVAHKYQWWGKFGTVMAGLVVNQAVGDVLIPTLPADLSTFTEVWNPNEDAAVIRSSVSDPDETQYTPRGVTFMFPAPIRVDPGSQLQFVLIHHKSLIGTQPAVLVAGTCVKYADFTLLYESK